QQALLEFIEDGRVTLIASTTENPYFAIHKAILSRSTIFKFEPITTDDLIIALNKAITKFNEDGYYIDIKDNVIHYIAEISQGDVRKAYTILELAVNCQSNDEILLSTEFIESLGQSNLKSDSSGDNYYNLLSAFQKSIRGSDADAAVHYLAKLIKGGNLESIIRRISVIASEDIGMAHPNALTVVNSGIDMCLRVGFPEASIILSQLTIYLATLPKSNSSYIAINKALKDLDEINVGDVPEHLRDTHYNGAKELGIKGYKYPHDFNYNYIKQQYMPYELKNKTYYTPQNNKYENSINTYWSAIKSK
ncbi:MAG: replication-associated recombination protein A, partial [Sarcina sp.]